jgi:hypothetical protein
MNVIFEVLTVVSIKITAFLHAMPCSLADKLPNFGKNLLPPSSTLKMGQQIPSQSFYHSNKLPGLTSKSHSSCNWSVKKKGFKSVIFSALKLRLYTHTHTHTHTHSLSLSLFLSSVRCCEQGNDLSAFHKLCRFLDSGRILAFVEGGVGESFVVSLGYCRL